MLLEPRGDVDWTKVKQVLKTIYQQSPEFLFENALIGGGAAWFYKTVLNKANDPDFKIELNPQKEILWLSKDIDFIGSNLNEYEVLLKTKKTGTPPRFYIEGVWIDTPEIGLTMHPDVVLKRTYQGYLEQDLGEYQVAHPADVLKEKLALVNSPKATKRPQDILHIEAIKEFIKFDLCQRIEKKELFQNAADAKAWRDDAILAKTVDWTIFSCSKLQRRLEVAYQNLESVSYSNSVRQWIKHHLKS